MKRLVMATLIGSICFSIAAQQTAAQEMQTEAGNLPRNGYVWPDTNGKHINAHGGNIIKYGGRYYWYGEHRPDRRGAAAQAGIAVYSSSDLCSWKDEGMALLVTEEKGHDIERGCIMERPKVLYNAKTQKFVMLFHLELKGRGYEAARVAFAVSDQPTGPFQFLRSTRLHAGKWPLDFTRRQKREAKATDASQWKKWWTPEWCKETERGMYLWRDFEGGQMSRDMTVFVDDDGKAYHITSSQENLTLLISELTDDCLDYTGRYVMVAPGEQNEAPTMLKHDGRYWMICSGCTGWDPNEARMYVADRIWGPWKRLASPFTGGEAEIHLLVDEQEGRSGDADAAGVDALKGASRRVVTREVVRSFPANKTFGAQGTYILDEGGRQWFMADIWNPRHLGRSLHIWLPIRFNEEGTPIIRWTEHPFE